MTNQSLLTAWGVTTTAGYLLTHAMGVAGTELLGLSPFGSIVAVWTALVLVPVGMTAALAARRRTDSHHWVWVGLVALGMLANVAAVAGGGGSHAAHGHGGSGSRGGSASNGAAEGSGHGSTGEGTDGAEESASEEGGHPHPDGGHSDDAPADGAGGSASAEAASTGRAESRTRASNSETDGGRIDGADLQHASFYHVWFLIGALGFAYSAAVAHGGGRRALYGTAALLNAGMVVALVAVPDAQGVAFLVAAAVQGLPMLIDLPLRARAGRPTAA